MDPAYWPSSCVLAARGGLQGEDRSEEDQRACLDCRDRRSFFRRLSDGRLCRVQPSRARLSDESLIRIVVQKSPVLKLGAGRLEIRSAFVTYTNEFFGGRTNALKIQFFTQRIGAETQAKLLKRDDRDIGKNGYAGLVLFLDAQDRVRQANLTYVIPGTTVVRTVASSPEELTRYISDYHFDRSRLRLKSRGTYKTAFDEKDEVLTLSWDTDIDLRVFDQIKR
jgi:hypothetical protein